MMTHWFTADTGHWLHWRWEEVKLLWLEAQAKLSWQTMAFCVKQHKTQAVACLRCAWRGNLQNDSFWKHLVGIVQHKLLWNMLYTVFLTHNWTNKTNNWFMFMCVLYLPLVFWPTWVFIWHMVTFSLKHFKTCFCWRCCFDPYSQHMRMRDRARQKVGFIPQQRAATIQIIIISLCIDASAIFLWKKVNFLFTTRKKRLQKGS